MIPEPLSVVGDMVLAVMEKCQQSLALQGFQLFFSKPLATLAKRGFGEVELHIHHDSDTDPGLRTNIREGLTQFASHGHISQFQNRPAFAFIHGNWALANGRPDGKWCGVDHEIPLLFEEGCYADFTFPSAPDICQPDIVNEIYWPTGDLSRRRAYDLCKQTAHVGTFQKDRLLFIQGPSALRRKGLTIKIESAALDAGNPPTIERITSWVRSNVHVQHRPEWTFVKLHSHGAPEANANVMLGPSIAAMHKHLTSQYNDGVRWKLHYVTAREMYNIAAAAMFGERGNPGHYRNYRIPKPPICQ